MAMGNQGKNKNKGAGSGWGMGWGWGSGLGAGKGAGTRTGETPTATRGPSTQQQGVTNLLPPDRTVFYGCNGIVASVTGKRKCKLWASDPSAAEITFSLASTFSVDLEKCPSKLTTAQKAQVQVDDGAHAPADKGNGSTSIGPRFPAQWEGAYLGSVYVADTYRATLEAGGIALPNPPPGAEGANGYEYQVAWYWPGGTDPRAGRRYFGHYATVISRDGTKAQVDIQPAGTTLPVKPVRIWIDLASEVDCDAGPGDGLTEIDTANSGALFLGSDPFAAMKALDYPKIPKWAGR